MCDVTTGVLIASTLFGAHQANQQGQFQQGIANYNADVANNNAIVQSRLAEDAIKRGEREELQHRLRVAKLKGDQRAAFGASGVDVGTGSPLVVASDTDALGELDALTIRNNAQREAHSHQVAATNYTNEASLQRQQGDLSASAGRSNAAGTLLTGGARVSESWYKNRKPTTPAPKSSGSHSWSTYF